MIKDSGERTKFETGAVRDMKTGKGRMDLLPWYGIMEVSKHCEEGAEKYGEHNIDKGIPLHSLCDSAARHLANFIAGEIDEDHLRASAWNLLWALNQRTTHPELDDLYSHKEKIEKVRKAKAKGELVFEDGPNEIDEECSGDISAEPSAIEPLSKELLLGMNGRFVYLVQRGHGVYMDTGWVQIKIDGNDIFIVKEDNEGNVIWEKPWRNDRTNCYVTNPKLLRKGDIHG